MSNGHRDFFNVPLFAVLIFCVNRFFVISLRRINESQRTTVAVMPMTGTIIIIVTEQRQYVVNQFKFPIMSMVGILKLSTYFLRMVINNASVFFIKLRIILTLNNYLIFLIENSNELIPVQITCGSGTVQEIGYFTGIERFFGLCSTFIGCICGINTAYQVIAMFYLAILVVTADDTADKCILFFAINVADVIAADYVAVVITDDTADIDGRFDSTGVITNCYSTVIQTGDTADTVITVDRADVITFRYHACIITDDTTDMVVAAYRAGIVTIANSTHVVTNNAADGVTVTENCTTLVITVYYVNCAITSYCADISVSTEIRVLHADICNRIVSGCIFGYITEQTDIKSTGIFVIQAGYGITVTVKASFERGVMILTDGSPFAETVGALFIQSRDQYILVHLDVRGQFTINGVITAIDCRSKSIQLLYRVNLIKTVFICVFQNDRFRTHRNGQVICSFCCINRQRKSTENRERHHDRNKHSQKARVFHY